MTHNGRRLVLVTLGDELDAVLFGRLVLVRVPDLRCRFAALEVWKGKGKVNVGRLCLSLHPSSSHTYLEFWMLSSSLHRLNSLRE